jgi:hypothetical protein
MTEVTPADVAARFGGHIGQADIADFIGQLEGAAKLNAAVAVSPVYGPGGDPDPMDLEYGYRWNFTQHVGRQPTQLEIDGLPSRSCDSCRRLSGTEACDGHKRKLGTPIAYPPKPWPSDDPGWIPGTTIVVRPGQKRPELVPWSHVASVR